MTGVDFDENRGTIENVIAHFNECDADFVKTLSSRVSLAEYAEKIIHRSRRFEAWEGKHLIGLLAAYYNRETGKGFITNLSVISGFQHCGIGKQLLMRCIHGMEAEGIMQIDLEVAKNNHSAQHFYDKHGFAVTIFGHLTHYMVRQNNNFIKQNESIIGAINTHDFNSATVT